MTGKAHHHASNRVLGFLGAGPALNQSLVDFWLETGRGAVPFRFLYLINAKLYLVLLFNMLDDCLSLNLHERAS
jgi:hypothetical protein